MKRRNEDHGFTLPEIVMTLGIVSFVLIPLMGLMTISSRNTYDADTVSISSSIATALLGDAQQASQEQIESWISSGRSDLYYDSQGNEIDDSAESNFTARMIIESGGVHLGGRSPNLNAARVVVYVCSVPGTNAEDTLDDYIRDPSSSTGNVRTYQSIQTTLRKVQ